jgi:hypothetical protein
LRPLPLVLVSALLALPARADDKEACIAAYEQTQAFRKSARPSLAKAQADTCVELCPESLAADCRRWASELAAERASVVLEARDRAGKPVDGVVVTIDGRPPPLPADGRVVTLDPGPHVFAFVSPEGEKLELGATLSAGEQSRRVAATFGPAVAPPPPGPPSPPPAPLPPPPPTTVAKGDPPIAGIVLVTTGLAALATGGALAIAGQVKVAELEDVCAPSCTDDDVAPVETYWLAGGITAGIGGAVLVTGIIVWAVTAASNEPDDTGSRGDPLVLRF